MSDLILHHYDASPFSEKIRAILGYKSQVYPNLRYSAVEIPIIMPKPSLMPLTGGYRKTPVAQLGADIYCDTELISRLIDRLYPNNPLYSEQSAVNQGVVAHWTDTFFFRVSVAVAFQPKALASSPLFSDPAAAEAFMADRAEFSKGSTELGMDPSVAVPHWQMHLRRLDETLRHQPFMFGANPCIADFSTYHCLWFVHNNEALREDFVPFNHVLDWMQRIAQFGHGNLVGMTGDAALDIAKTSVPEASAKQGMIQDAELGTEVDVLPIDYGFQPTRGKLLINSAEEIAVQRTDETVGDVVVHFPRLGFRTEPAP